MNYAYIFDGVRLCKPARYHNENSSMEDVDQQFIKATVAGSKFKIIGTDGFAQWMVLLVQEIKFAI